MYSSPSTKYYCGLANLPAPSLLQLIDQLVTKYSIGHEFQFHSSLNFFYYLGLIFSSSGNLLCRILVVCVVAVFILTEIY